MYTIQPRAGNAFITSLQPALAFFKPLVINSTLLRRVSGD